MSYTASSTDPYPNMNISMDILPYGAIGTWQTADGLVGGSTASMQYGALDPGLSLEGTAPFPKYRFLQQGVTYAPVGSPIAQTNYVLTIDVGYDNKATGLLQPWPLPPRGDSALYPEMTGSLNGNVLTMRWQPRQGH